MSVSKNYSNGLSFTTILFLIFMTLKLMNYIDWSWWWVSAPLWIPAAILLLILILTASIVSAGILLKKRKPKKVGTFYKKH